MGGGSGRETEAETERRPFHAHPRGNVSSLGSRPSPARRATRFNSARTGGMRPSGKCRPSPAARAPGPSPHLCGLPLPTGLGSHVTKASRAGLHRVLLHGASEHLRPQELSPAPVPLPTLVPQLQPHDDSQKCPGRASGPRARPNRSSAAYSPPSFSLRGDLTQCDPHTHSVHSSVPHTRSVPRLCFIFS